jgi:hypothetical protein
MKCQACDKAAVHHVTEIVAGAPAEYHVCEDHLQTLDSMGPPRIAPVVENGFGEFLRVPELVAALRDEETQKKVAAYLLPPLCLALLDPRPEVRVAAAFRLMALGENAQSAVGALQDALQDSDERVRQAARIARESIQSNEARPWFGVHLA